MYYRAFSTLDKRWVPWLADTCRATGRGLLFEHFPQTKKKCIIIKQDDLLYLSNVSYECNKGVFVIRLAR